jgi:hypothetical protein
MDDIETVNLPRGNALDWDITTLTDKQLAYEYRLCYECLYGAEIAGVDVLKGLMDEDYLSVGVRADQLDEARRVWQERLKRAEDELFERKLL